MVEERFANMQIGRRVYAIAAIVLGLVGLWWHDFASVWQRVPPGTPHRRALAMLTAACFLFAGMALWWRQSARVGTIVLMALYLGAALTWLPAVIGYPRIYGTWAGFFEQFSVVAAGLVLYATLASPGARWAERTGRIGTMLFGLCAVSFGVAHFTAIPQTAAMVPRWIPPGGIFWAWVTGVFHLLAGLAILTGVLAPLASRLLTAMLLGFGLLVWLPTLFTQSHAHISWAGNAINLTLTGGAWVVADWLASRHARSAAAV